MTAVRYDSGEVDHVARDDLPDETELRLCGDLSGKRRTIELGIGPSFNSLAVAGGGGKAIAVDTDAERIAALRRAAHAAELTVECHLGDLADLGFATSASIDAVLAVHTVDDVDDLGRLLRQVHRVLKSQAPLIIATRHPAASLFARPAPSVPADSTASEPHAASPARYGAHGRTIGEWFTALGRANFHVDVIHELSTSHHAPGPDVLLIRARREGS